MTFRRISSFRGSGSADELLNLSIPKLAEIVLQHLKSYEGTHTVVQNGMVNRCYFTGMIEGRNMGLGVSSRQPEYGEKQPAISEALEEAWSWLVSEGMLMRVSGQPAEWYKVTRSGEACIRRLARQDESQRNG
jgi:hypothetical protein